MNIEARLETLGLVLPAPIKVPPDVPIPIEAEVEISPAG